MTSNVFLRDMGNLKHFLLYCITQLSQGCVSSLQSSVHSEILSQNSIFKTIIKIVFFLITCTHLV